MKALISPLLCLLLAWLPSFAGADVYLYKDAAGIEHYTNVRVNDRYRRIVSVLKREGRRNLAHAVPKPANVARFAPIVAKAANRYGVDRALLHAVITVESGYNPDAVSKVGAKGLMQLVPETARRYDVTDVFDPSQNIRAGAHYLGDLLHRFGGNVKLALAAYNAGEGTVIKYGGRIPPYPETRAYVRKVMGLYRRFENI